MSAPPLREPSQSAPRTQPIGLPTPARKGEGWRGRRDRPAGASERPTRGVIRGVLNVRGHLRPLLPQSSLPASAPWECCYSLLKTCKVKKPRPRFNNGTVARFPYFLASMRTLTQQVYEDHAAACSRAAEQTDDPVFRRMLLMLGLQWKLAAQQEEKPETCYCSALPKGSGLCLPCYTRWLAGRRS